MILDNGLKFMEELKQSIEGITGEPFYISQVKCVEYYIFTVTFKYKGVSFSVRESSENCWDSFSSLREIVFTEYKARNVVLKDGELIALISRIAKYIILSDKYASEIKRCAKELKIKNKVLKKQKDIKHGRNK